MLSTKKTAPQDPIEMQRRPSQIQEEQDHHLRITTIYEEVVAKWTPLLKPHPERPLSKEIAKQLESENLNDDIKKLSLILQSLPEDQTKFPYEEALDFHNNLLRLQHTHKQ